MNKAKLVVFGIFAMTLFTVNTVAQPDKPELSDGTVTGVDTKEKDIYDVSTEFISDDNLDNVVIDKDEKGVSVVSTVSGKFVTAVEEKPTISSFYSDDKLIIRLILDGGVANRREELLASAEWSKEYNVKPENLSSQRLATIVRAYEMLGKPYSEKDVPEVSYSELGFVKHIVNRGTGVSINGDLDTSGDITKIKYEDSNTGDIYYNKEKGIIGIYLWDGDDKSPFIIRCSSSAGKVVIEKASKQLEYYRVNMSESF